MTKKRSSRVNVTLAPPADGAEPAVHLLLLHPQQPQPPGIQFPGPHADPCNLVQVENTGAASWWSRAHSDPSGRSRACGPYTAPAITATHPTHPPTQIPVPPCRPIAALGSTHLPHDVITRRASGGSAGACPKAAVKRRAAAHTTIRAHYLL